MGLRKIREIFWYNFHVKIIPKRRQNIENTDFYTYRTLIWCRMIVKNVLESYGQFLSNLRSGEKSGEKSTSA